MQVISNRIKAAANSNERIHHFYFLSRYAERRAEPGICDFTFGKPHEMPLPGLVEAIRPCYPSQQGVVRIQDK